MKKIKLTFTLIVAMILFLSACQGGEKIEESLAKESETEIKNDGVAKTEKQNDDEEGSEFHTEIPSINKISSDEVEIAFDSAYEEVCWNDCENIETDNYIDMHSGDVEVGERILIDWTNMKPAPSEVNLIQVNNSEEEVSKKNIHTESSTLDIQVSKEEIGKQYAIQFSWEDGNKLKGYSVLNFKLE